MSFPIIFLLLFTFIGLADKLANNRLGLAEELDKGLSTMGSLALSMGGIYCFSVMLGPWRWHKTAFPCPLIFLF